VAEHYRAKHAPAHRMRGTGSETMLVGCCARAWSRSRPPGYLGAELAKAETAMRLGLRYEQDKPIRTRDPSGERQP